MSTNLRIVIAARDRASLDQLSAMTRDYFGCEPILQHITNGHADPLYGHTDRPDLLILELAADWREQLGAIYARPAAARPILGLRHGRHERHCNVR